MKESVALGFIFWMMMVFIAMVAIFINSEVRSESDKVKLCYSTLYEIKPYKESIIKNHCYE